MSESGTPEAILSEAQWETCLAARRHSQDVHAVALRAHDETLRAEVERLTADLDRARLEGGAAGRMYDDAQKHRYVAEARVAELTAENEALKKELRRVVWLAEDLMARAGVKR